MKIILWLSLFIAFYTFAGYGIFLFLLVKIKRLLKGGKPGFNNTDLLPTCTLVVAAYNEADSIREKIINTLALTYPADKLKFVFITDGSTDNTLGIIAEYPQIILLHQDERAGKIAAVHRAMEYIDTDAVVFTDANTMLNADALEKICRHYTNKKVGAVAGEKRVAMQTTDDASAAGEGFYWKYESALKKWDSELYSVVGAAGELFSIRRELYEAIAPDTILDDFMISMLIAAKGYRIVYEPEAYATESASANVSEELKRKIRIAAGGMQSVLRLKRLLNPFRYPLLSFQYISHRVLRWTVTPFLLVIAFILNVVIVLTGGAFTYHLLLMAQVIFYLLALFGLIMERQQLRIKVLFIPYYFCVMNYAVIAGIVRYITGKQSAIWEKVQRRG